MRDVSRKPVTFDLRDTSANVFFVEDWAAFGEWAEAVNKLGPESLASLALALNDTTPPGEADYQLFRACLNTGDSASRFLSLYRLLGRLADTSGKDRQSLIDALIRKHEPRVEETPSPKTGAMESVYSRLRNEQMHRGHVPVSDVRHEMEIHLRGLIEVVRKAIKCQ